MGKLVKCEEVPLLLHVTGVGRILMGELMKKKLKREWVDGGIRELMRFWDTEVFRPRDLGISIERRDENGVSGFGGGMKQEGPPPNAHDDSASSSHSDSDLEEHHHSHSGSHSQSQSHPISPYSLDRDRQPPWSSSS